MLSFSIVLLPVGATAHDASESPRGGIHPEIKQSDILVRKGGLPIVRPVPPLRVVAEDAARVAGDLEAARRQEEVERDVTGRSARPPVIDQELAGP